MDNTLTMSLTQNNRFSLLLGSPFLKNKNISIHYACILTPKDRHFQQMKDLIVKTK